MGRTGELIALMNTSQGLLWAGNNNGTTTDGLQIDWVTVDTGNAPIVTVVLMGGSDLTADIVEGLTNNDATALAVAMSFEPEVLIGISTRSINAEFDPEEVTTFWAATVSFTTNDGAGGVVTRSANSRSGDGVTTSEGSFLNSSTHVIVNLNVATVGATYIVENFSATGFDIRRVSGTGRLPFAFLGLDFGDAVSFDVDHISAPSGTGDQAFTEPGFKPQLVLAVLTTDVNVDETYDITNQFGVGIGVFDQEPTESSCSVAVEDGLVSDTDTQSLTDNVFCNLADHAGVTALDASLVSRDPTGFTLNFATTTTNLKILYLAIAQENHVPSMMHQYRQRRNS